MHPATDAQHPPLPVPEGTLIAGKYVVGRTLASGGMGVVAEGRHEALDQRVAIKFLLPEIAKRSEAVQRFLREARSAAKVESDHIVRIFDVGMHEDVPYMVMEFLVGTDLEAQVDRGGPMQLAMAIDLVTQAVEGLAQAHTLGIVHRDLKPANLFVVERTDRARSRRVKILDFGISKLMPDSERLDTGITTSRSLLGSPGYMSPEQVRSTKNVDARTDVWSMGVIFYELLTGEPPFSGETLGDVFAKIREEPLASIRERRPDVPIELDHIIMKCLDRDRAGRYRDANELYEALIPFAEARVSVVDQEALKSSQRTRTAVASTLIAPPSALEGGGAFRRDGSSTQATWSDAQRRPKKQWAIAAFVICGVAALVVAVWSMRRTPVEGAATTTPSVPSEFPSVVAPTPSGQVVVSPGDAPSSAVSAIPIVSATAAASASSIPSLPWRPGGALPPGTKPFPGKKKDDLGI